ncbi:metal-sensitive transcriptional regulator [Jiella pelagia]|jgi:CsoR family transcriptional regulator, copper-sensing transcriptional repressor|uniref:Metal-sensitive transcriptional regulator n=2 Tax=Aurantimonadaceae TaxID=255475 RepID=A0ABY7C6Q3_9HYPH|nr:metal-sensitive transcriptional regulator [Jiella pelagia]WAP71426.1 metal-sensitive transcriptional regulator [Jiella pelagia]
MSSDAMRDRKHAALQRLARLEGQVRGVIRMIEDDRYCVDILNQTLAIRSALAQVEVLILEDHADDCVEEAIASTNPEAQREKFRELVGIFEKICR